MFDTATDNGGGRVSVADTAERHSDYSAPEPPPPNGLALLRRRLSRWARRTEGKLTLVTAALVGLCLLSGLVGTLGITQRADLLNAVAERNAPLIQRTFTVYRSLADADATSADAFLAGAAESPSVRSTFEQDIATAGSALTSASALSATLPQSDVQVTSTDCTASSTPPAGSVAQRLDLLARNLAVYTGLIETARTYNRQGLPLGAAYLNLASTVLRRDMLPQARVLYDEESALVAASEGQAAEFPWLALLLVVLLTGALIVVQVRLRRHTRRSFNIGLLAATLAVVAGGIWLIVASAIEGGAVDTSRAVDTTQIQVLAAALTDAQQARTDEALTLIARGAGAQFENDFTRRIGCLDTALKNVTQPDIAVPISDARATLVQWRQTHGTVRQHDDAGDTTGAVSDVINAGTSATPTTNGLAGTIDADLSKAVDQVRARSDDQIHSAREALSGTEIGFAVLIGIALVSAAAGMWPRIAEYR
jgi:hypothetical protein